MAGPTDRLSGQNGPSAPARGRALAAPERRAAAEVDADASRASGRPGDLAVPRVEETMTTARPLYRPDASALPAGTGARGLVGTPLSPVGRRPESPSERTSLVPRRGSGKARGAGAAPDDDSGWQPSRSVRKPSGRSVPADRRRTPNPVTDTNSLQPVSAPQPIRSSGSTRSGEGGAASAGERRRGTADRAGRAGGTGARSRGHAGRHEEGAGVGGHSGPGRRAYGRDARAVGLREQGDARDEPEGEDFSGEDRLAWLRQDWIGPLAVALVLALLAVGGYALLRGDGGGKSAPSVSPAPPSGSPTPTTTSPDAINGKAMIDGSWECRLVTGTNPLKLSDNVVGVLVVERTAGAYSWDGTAGQYTITPVAGNDGGNVIGNVKFTSGPLKDLSGVHIAKPGAGIRDKAQGTLELTASGSAPHRYCGVN
ncbi:hypothetical protein [Frankia sp. CeD]|uniref:hypothetical protein n=1 Tax=Frankia sp. CeD TaxID=258230 RepID=UPI001362557C|nr:hypothetical protein [Frankia sp. CeD]